MAKIRVYELARDLNMKNKELLDKLEELNVTVRSHMSSLDDDTVAQIKSNLLEKKKPGVELTRVRPTVIRRRKKIAKEGQAADTLLEAKGLEKAADEMRPEKEDIAVAEELRTDEKPEPEEEEGALFDAGTIPASKGEEEDFRARDAIKGGAEAKVGQTEFVEKTEPVEAGETGVAREGVPEEKVKSEVSKTRKKKKKVSEPSAKIISRPEQAKTESVKFGEEKKAESPTTEQQVEPSVEEEHGEVAAEASAEESALRTETAEAHPEPEFEDEAEIESVGETEPDQKVGVEPVEQKGPKSIATE